MADGSPDGLPHDVLQEINHSPRGRDGTGRDLTGCGSAALGISFYAVCSTGKFVSKAVVLCSAALMMMMYCPRLSSSCKGARKLVTGLFMCACRERTREVLDWHTGSSKSPR